MQRGVDGRTLLASIAIFEGLEEEVLELLLGITRTRELAAGEVLFRKGDLGNRVYGVMRGRLRVLGERDDGEEVAFATLGPGEVFGEVALLDSSPRSATVESLEPSCLLSLHRGEFLPFLERHPSVAIKLAGVLARRLRALSALMEDTLFLTLPSRLALNLIALARFVDGASSDGVSFDISLPRTQLDQICGADKLDGRVREWEREGLVTLQDGVVTINGLEGLESLARFLIT